MVWSVISACRLQATYTQSEQRNHPETPSPLVKSLSILNPIVSYGYLSSIILALVIFTLRPHVPLPEYIFNHFLYVYSTSAIGELDMMMYSYSNVFSYLMPIFLFVCMQYLQGFV